MMSGLSMAVSRSKNDRKGQSVEGSERGEKGWLNKE